MAAGLQASAPTTWIDDPTGYGHVQAHKAQQNIWSLSLLRVRAGVPATWIDEAGAVRVEPAEQGPRGLGRVRRPGPLAAEAQRVRVARPADGELDPASQ
jgi:hypothetical protein